MTGQEVVLDLLRYIGVTGFAPVDNDQALNRPGLDDDDTRKALAAVNAALQEIQRYGPQSLKDGERSALFNAPTSLAIASIGSGATTATASAPVPAWMEGCSILLDNDGEVNRILSIAGPAISFLRAYRGDAAVNIGSTVYGDCALLGSEVAAVLESVEGTGNVFPRAARSLKEFNRYCMYRSYGAIGGNPNGLIIGTPSMYYGERRRDGRIFLRINPRPGTRINVTFQAKLRAERIDAAGTLALDGGEDPNYEFTSLHQDEVESVLLPLARGKFFAHPALKNAESRQAVMKEYDAVMLRLTNGATFEPAVHSDRTHYI